MRKFLLSIFICLSLCGCSFFHLTWDDEEIHEIAQNTIPNFENRYYLSKLKGNDLAFVVKAYEALMNFEDRVTMDLKFDDLDHIETLMDLLQYDCPEIFQFSTNGSSTVLYHYIHGTG
ncbi:MAG: hypothetical protein HUJ53_05880, partial [Holdemanella sp.]|nr:hypothetical protein [Holdemanella sp.]